MSIKGLNLQDLEVLKASQLWEEPVVLHQEQTIAKVLPLFNKGVRSVFIIDDEDNIVGVVEQKTVLKSKLPLQTKLKTLMRPIARVHEDASVVDIAREMVNTNVKALVVEGSKKIVSEDSLLKAVIPVFESINCSQLMTSGIVVEKPDTPIGFVISVMREHNIAHLPIIENNELLGIVSVKDIVEKLLHPEEKPRVGEVSGEKKHLLKLPVSSVMSKQVITVNPNDKVSKAVKLMLENNISSVVVVNQGVVVGIITRHDLLLRIATLKFEEKPIMVIGDYDKVETFEKNIINKDLQRFMEKYSKMFEPCSLTAHFKALRYHKDKNAQLFQIRLKFYTPTKVFIAKHEGYGALLTLQVALDKLSREVLKHKVIEEKEFSRYASKFLEEAGF